MAGIAKSWLELLNEQPGLSDAKKSLAGYAVDLKSAYKQLGTAPAHRAYGVVVSWNAESGRAELRISYALSFGAASAVYHFNRTSRALEHILNQIFSIPVSAYFDDFPIVAPIELVGFLGTATEKVLRLLGWQVKPQTLQPSPLFESLGVVFDWRNSAVGEFEIQNKQSRIESLVGEVEAILQEDSYRPSTLASLHGKLRFARAQCFPRAGASALNTMAKYLSRAGGRRKLDEELRRTLAWWPRFFLSARPRVVRTPTSDPPVFLFTDGAYHDEGGAVASIGAVLLNHGSTIRAGGSAVPEALRLAWTGGTDRQVIGQAEILPVLVAMRLWAHHLQGKKIVCFIDNDSARGALVKGYSPVKASAYLIQLIGIEEAKLSLFTWFSRLPSESNIADGPSRLAFDRVQRLGAVLDDFTVPEDIVAGELGWVADPLCATAALPQ